MSNCTTFEHSTTSSNVLIVFIVFKCLFFIAGILGNASVIIYNVFLNHSKTPTSYFVVSLAINDLLACSLIYPIWIAEFVRDVLEITSDHMLPRFVTGTIAPITVLLSILTILAITVDKFVFINWPLKYHLMVTWRRTHFALLVIWVVGIVLIPFLQLFHTGKCVTNAFLWIFILLVYVFSPFSIIFILNYKIFKIAREQRLKIAVNSLPSDIMQSSNSSSLNLAFSRFRITRELKTIKTFSIIIGVLFCCISPCMILLFVEVIWCNGSCAVPVEVRLLFGDLLGVNSIVNPFVYGIRQREYRNAFRRFLSKVYFFRES